MRTVLLWRTIYCRSVQRNQPSPDVNVRLSVDHLRQGSPSQFAREQYFDANYVPEEKLFSTVVVRKPKSPHTSSRDINFDVDLQSKNSSTVLPQPSLGICVPAPQPTRWAPHVSISQEVQKLILTPSCYRINRQQTRYMVPLTADRGRIP